MVRVARFNSGDRWGGRGLVYGPLKEPEVKKPMSNDNMISQSIPAADKALAKQKTAEIQALLPFLTNIPAEDKKGFQVIGKNRAGMDVDFVEQMTLRPDLMPGFVDLAEVKKDLALRRDLDEIAMALEQLLESIQDTSALANHDCLMAYLAFYNNVKSAQQRGVAGSDAVLTALAKYFPNSRKAAVTPVVPPAK